MNALFVEYGRGLREPHVCRVRDKNSWSTIPKVFSFWIVSRLADFYAFFGKFECVQYTRIFLSKVKYNISRYI